jgi:hypothetical protein
LKRIAFTNSHDGSGAARIAITPFRLRCKNGLVSAMAGSAITVRHSKTGADRMQQAARILRGIEAQMIRTEATYNALAASKVARDQFAEVLETLFPTEDKTNKAAKNATEAKEAISRYYQDADGNFMERNTGWNLFNSITRFTDHDSPIRANGADHNEARAASMLTGAIAEKNAKALATCVKVLELDDDIARILAQVETSQAAQLAAYAPAPVSIWDIEVAK